VSGGHGHAYGVITEVSRNVFTVWQKCLYWIYFVDGVVIFHILWLTDSISAVQTIVHLTFVTEKFGILVVYLPDFLCVATLPSVFCIVSHFALQPVVRQGPRCTPCFVVNWLIADVSLWPFFVYTRRMYLTVRWPLYLTCSVSNICMVRVVTRNIVPGSIMTAEWWYCQRNPVSLPEEFVEECFPRLQFVYFSLCWRPWNVAADTRNTTNYFWLLHSDDSAGLSFAESLRHSRIMRIADCWPQWRIAIHSFLDVWDMHFVSTGVLISP